LKLTVNYNVKHPCSITCYIMCGGLGKPIGSHQTLFWVMLVSQYLKSDSGHLDLLMRSAMTIYILKPWCCTKLADLSRSSAVPQSLVLRVVGSGQKCCRLVMMGQVCRMCLVAEPTFTDSSWVDTLHTNEEFMSKIHHIVVVYTTCHHQTMLFEEYTSPSGLTGIKPWLTSGYHSPETISKSTTLQWSMLKDSIPSWQIPSILAKYLKWSNIGRGVTYWYSHGMISCRGAHRSMLREHCSVPVCTHLITKITPTFFFFAIDDNIKFLDLWMRLIWL
jgi:hypothetical protein